MGVGVEVVISAGLVAANDFICWVARGVVKIRYFFDVFVCCDLEMIWGAAVFGGRAVAALLIVIAASLSPTHFPILLLLLFSTSKIETFWLEEGFWENERSSSVFKASSFACLLLLIVKADRSEF